MAFTTPNDGWAGALPSRHRSRRTHRRLVVSLIAERVAELDKELAARGGQRESSRDDSGRQAVSYVQVVVLVVITNIQRGSGIQEIGEQNVRGKAFGSLLVDQQLVGQHAVVIQDGPQGEGTSELKIDFRPANVICENTGGSRRCQQGSRPGAEPGVEISLIEAESRHRP